MQNAKTKCCALLLFSVIIVGLFALSPTFSSLMNTIIINSTGRISHSSITANSGSPADIQTAVNAIVSAGGGTVYVPAGTFTFNPPWNGTGVTIPFANVPINIIGAGIGVTILQETKNPGMAGCMFGNHWAGQNYNGSAIRVSGISFAGYVVNESVTSNCGIILQCIQDYRIDHCSFQNFESAAIETTDSTGSTRLVCTGVIDHCSFDNPYKDGCYPHNATGPPGVWGYGIIVLGSYWTWDPTITDYLGGYNPTTTYSGLPVPQVTYIENCNFSRCRHAISANGAGYYVARYDYFQQASEYGQCDCHGDVGTPAWGARGMEVYSCIFNFTDESYSYGQDQALEPRGGGGVCWNNTVILNPSYSTRTIGFGNDGEIAPYDVEQFYIWNNTAMWTNGTLTDFNSHIGVASGSTFSGSVNVNYFLRAPNQTLDGFNYAPYTYPMPLTLSATS